MMGRRAFVLLNGAEGGPEVAKQAEICPAAFLKILWIRGWEHEPRPLGRVQFATSRLFRAAGVFPPIMANSPKIERNVI
jgi:hypothetical protein